MKYLITLCLFTSFLLASAQEREITGRIIDKSSQQPIADANIIVHGTTTGSVSNAMGYFKLKIKPNYKSLVISHVSYQRGIAQIPDSGKFKIQLEKIFVVLPKITLSFRPPELAPYQPLNKIKDDKKYYQLEQSASFYGGFEYLNYYLITTFKYPESLKKRIGGETLVSFEIDNKGGVNSIKIHDDSLNIMMKSQIVELFTSMPAWRPAFQRGKPVAQKFLVAIIYGPVIGSAATDTYLNYYLARTISYPAEAKRLAVEGTVFIYFVLNSQQNFTRLEILQGIGSGGDKMVYDAINNLPKAELKNLMLEVGDSIFVLPVDFRLDPSSNNVDQLVRPTEAVFLMPVEVFASGNNNYNSFQYGNYYRPTSEFYSVEGALKHVYNASKLRIVNQQLDSLSPKVGRLVYLELLDLENNKLLSLPREVASLHYLNELYAPHNELSSLPAAMIKMNKLRIIGLANNKFAEFPAPLLGLRRLVALDLSNNNISTIPAGISNMKNLKILFLSNNNLQSLPEEFFKLKLTELKLEGNNLSKELQLRIKKSFKNAKISF
jgi:CarboxypepD_reg-like domain/Leucine rich repeat/Gram-negative bacterial TonB protein C-terminal